MILEALKALFIGIVEGITEWLPISSTGHMILVDEFVKLDVSDQFLALFLVVIQLGAIMAVILLYFHKLNPFSPKKTHAEKRGTWRLWGMVAIGCIPAAIVGLLLDDWVNEHFYNAYTVAIMLILYGVVFIVMERRNRKKALRLMEVGATPAGREMLEAPCAVVMPASSANTQRSAPKQRSSRSAMWTISIGRRRSRSAASRCLLSFRARAVQALPSSVACSAVVRVPPPQNTRSFWPSPSCSAGA